VTQTGAELQIVSPEEEFGLDAYDEVVHDYLHSVLVEESPELEAFRAVAENQLCLDGVDESDLSQATEMSSQFAFKNAQDFSLRVIKAAADKHSYQVRNRYDLEQEGGWTRDQIETRCERRYEHATTCIPVFCRDRGREWIDLYFLKNGSEEVEKEGPLKLL
jgi:hypothetical protein